MVLKNSALKTFSLPFVILLILMLISCKNETADKATDKQENTAQADTLDEGPVLLGKYSIDVLTNEPYNQWLTQGYNAYNPNAEVLEKVKPYLNESIQIRLFMGTWCEDSRREVPTFLKVLDQLGYPRKNLNTVMVDTLYQTPNGLEKGFDIIRVPTIIFYKDTTEINRIVELPIETIEKDMLNILSGQFYRHAYDF